MDVPVFWRFLIMVCVADPFDARGKSRFFEIKKSSCLEEIWEMKWASLRSWITCFLSRYFLWREEARIHGWKGKFYTFDSNRMHSNRRRRILLFSFPCVFSEVKYHLFRVTEPRETAFNLLVPMKYTIFFSGTPANARCRRAGSLWRWCIESFTAVLRTNAVNTRRELGARVWRTVWRRIEW